MGGAGTEGGGHKEGQGGREAGKRAGRKKGAQREGGEAEDKLGNGAGAEQSWRKGCLGLG